MFILAMLCLALALAMSVSMSTFSRWVPAVDWLAFIVMSGYVVFMLAFLILLDRQQEPR